ncbi:Riboflavin kinase [Dissulfuribacter thermophilus]|uniref:Riboflavin biosynthesis protein n=1 Tax=Dissulfuribacter thermophilus TaxID=1156395 RepID=A0A1B9F9D3_9BACT|nr:bifunctional riboflavin kinase/FAD synthetase [Dissulfuribacter thermophilus]OCC16465.1 Riboflavin kinase [Dissulfuribacter thermophilus]
MQILRSLEEIKRPFFRPAVTIGNFDGVHLGHQALFKKVVDLASKRDGDTIAITFEPHPLKVLRPKSSLKLISTFEHKAELIKKAGIEWLLCLRFDKELASTPAREFVERVFVRKIGVEDLVVGYDYAFGKGREGDREFLKTMGDIFGFKVHVVDPVMIDGVIVSSTKVRELVSNGEMRRVYKLLGRYYQIRGVVRVGKRRGGSVVGFPTANLVLEEDDLCPKVGVYCVQVILDSQCFGGVMNIGYNPTFGDTGLSAEVHIFDFDKDIYGKAIKVNIIQRIRDEKKFSGPLELREQICKDVETAKLILAKEQNLTRACLDEQDD